MEVERKNNVKHCRMFPAWECVIIDILILNAVTITNWTMTRLFGHNLYLASIKSSYKNVFFEEWNRYLNDFWITSETEILDVSIHVSVRSSILYCFWSTPVVVLSNNHALSTLIISIITGTKNILPHTAVWTLPSYISNRTKWFSLLGLFQCCIYSFYVINSLC